MLVDWRWNTGVQIAGHVPRLRYQVQLFERGPRILRAADEAVAAAVAAGLRESGIVVHERFGTITSFETDGGRRTHELPRR